MISKFAIWMVVILYCFFFAGHLFDLVVNVPNWESGDISSISNYRDFYQKTTPKAYFLPLMISIFIVNLLALISIRREKKRVKSLISISLGTLIVVFVFTIFVFVPINDYIFSTSTYDTKKLEELVNKWVKLDYLRLFLVGIGLTTSIFAISNYNQGLTES